MSGTGRRSQAQGCADLLRLGEEEEQDAGEVVRVAVGVPQLVRQRIQEQVPALFKKWIRGSASSENAQSMHCDSAGDESSVASDMIGYGAAFAARA
jgi:hypothetical protein